jgi:hypothetical protein
MIVGAFCAVVWFAAPQISMLYNQHQNGSLFFRLTAVSLMLTSLMVIPQVRMERQPPLRSLLSSKYLKPLATMRLRFYSRGFGILACALGS